MVAEWAARGRAWIPPGTQLGRFYRAWSFQFARLPSFSKPFWALWSEQEAAAAEAEAKMAAWECRVQELPGLQVFSTESAIGPSDVSGEPSRQQAARPLRWSSNRLWQSLQHREEGAEEDCRSTLRVRQQCHRGFETSFEGWSLALHRCPAYAARRCPASCQDSANMTPGRCVVRRCCSVPAASSVPMQGQCQRIEAQTVAGSLGAGGNGCVLLVSTVREE